MATDPFTELLWNHVCVPRLMDASALSPLSVLSRHPDGYETLPEAGNMGAAGSGALVDLGSLPASLTGGPVVDPGRIEAASGALAYLREAHAFINGIQHTAEGAIGSPSLAAGSGLMGLDMPLGTTETAVSVGTSEAVVPSPSVLVPLADEPVITDPDGGTSAGESGPDASQYMWIGNASAAEAIAKACFIDPGLSHVMDMARTTIHGVMPGVEGVGAILDAAVTHVNWNAQFNILQDSDEIGQSLTVASFDTPAHFQTDWHTAAQNVTAGGNTSTNEASLQGSDPGYDLIIVAGDYYEYNIVLQINIVFDNDFIHQLFGAGAADGSYEGEANAGGNSSVNEAGIIKVGLGAPLLLGGDYYQSNAFLQYSFLSDMDILKAAAIMLGIDGSETSYDLLQGILAGGNSQQNGLSVYEVGASANLWSLESLSALKLSFFTGEDSLGALLTLDEDETLAPGTLYVDGDYAEVNVLIQVNVIFDSDTIDQEAMTGGGRAGQDASSGGNTANNSAYIIDTGSSAVLVVAGDYYESNTVIQANFIQDNDTIFQEAEISAPQHALASSDQDDALPHGLTDSLYSMSA